MSAYDPPTEDIGVFNSSLFTSTSENITQSYADTHYLKFPTSQSATETISSLVVSNDATINGLTVGKGNSSVSTNTVVGSMILRINSLSETDNYNYDRDEIIEIMFLIFYYFKILRNLQATSLTNSRQYIIFPLMLLVTLDLDDAQYQQ